MQSLIQQSRDYCALIARTNTFFQKLEAGALDNLMFVYQLRVWCGDFISSLFLAAAMCEDPAHNKIRRQHAIEEGRHPDQLDRWMQKRDMTLPLPRITREGEALRQFVRNVAMNGPDPFRVVVLNVFMERLALVTFQALIKRFGTEVLDGPYWEVHEKVDEAHAAMGTDLVDKEWLDGNRVLMEQILERTAYLADKWLASLAM